ncbi:hypothetical protein HaLaN_00062 [Haematococcus lacustris]|uniref:Uncharacterized protein n=1 Tax=Haematococcus lacustris TaxID=44745 RepID=A0A699YCK7_HAELA|nr:hypothetical protein HaLaN_00062 [Haematococcus lacustris]
MYLFELNKIPPGRLVPQSFPHVPLVPLVANWPEPRQMDAVLGFAAGWDAMACYDSDDEELTAGPRFRPGKKVRCGLEAWAKRQAGAAMLQRGAVVVPGRSSWGLGRSSCGARQEQLWCQAGAAVVPGRSSCGARG